MRRLLERMGLFHCRYPKVRRLLEGGAYLRPSGNTVKQSDSQIVGFVIYNLQYDLQVEFHWKRE